MVALARARVAWSGSAVVGPGVSTLYTTDPPTGFPAAVSDLFEALVLYLPLGVTITVPSAGDIIESSTGEITAPWSAAGGRVVEGVGAANHAKGVGGRIEWLTNTRTNGRRIRGTTFIVPLSFDQYAADGTIATACITSMQTAADTFLASGAVNLRIFSRPRPGVPGGVASVVGARAVDKVSWLSSRKN